ncbi:hypothetical protein M9H77_03975 [Catharanthus roseus]|uniref:Uncharacterized protein n=1 Tax=Catharanthus roseus TaxID=4058 RepID=A0ACC0CCS5_CATRO|nr:hypothetical protein M9H77_03975 [Catharanthus roseus]
MYKTGRVLQLGPESEATLLASVQSPAPALSTRGPNSSSNNPGVGTSYGPPHRGPAYANDPSATSNSPVTSVEHGPLPCGLDNISHDPESPHGTPQSSSGPVPSSGADPHSNPLPAQRPPMAKAQSFTGPPRMTSTPTGSLPSEPPSLQPNPSLLCYLQHLKLEQIFGLNSCAHVFI